MSLLMQALKKAEHAKKKAAPADTNDHYPPLDATVTEQSQPEPEPVLQLTQPEPEPGPVMQLSLTDTEVAAQAAVVQPKQESPPAMTLQDLIPQPKVAVPRQSVDQAMQSQQQAQSVLMAKQPARAYSLSMVLAAALLGVVLCSAAALYYWQSVQPNLAMPVPYRTATQPNLPTAIATPVNTVTPTAVDVRVPVVTNTDTHSDKHADANKPIRSAGTESNKTPGHLIRETAGQSEAEQIRIHKSERPAKINAILTQAYELYTAGERNAARPLYDSVLREEPNNRDAILGLAGIELGLHHTERAAALYSRLLDQNPLDADAIAALTSLRSDSPEQSESQLKKVLARTPDSGATLFELGNLYSRQSRWSEAQDAYFRAFSNAPHNADYAFNLAVSLDRLGQFRLALDYYQQALTLAGAAPGNFSQAQVSSRIAQLQSVNR